MPLFDLQGRPLNGQWFPETWRLIRKRLVPLARFNSVITGIDQLMIATHDKVTVPGFKAQANWTGLPWYDIWDIAAKHDQELAAKMLGLMAMHAFQIHPDDWFTTKTHYAGHKHENRIYFSHRIFRR